MRDAIAAAGLIYHLDMHRTVDREPAHLLKSVFSGQRNPGLDTMCRRTYSGDFCVIGELDLSRLCGLRCGRCLRQGAIQIDVQDRQCESDRDEPVFVGAGGCHRTSPLNWRTARTRGQQVQGFMVVIVQARLFGSIYKDPICNLSSTCLNPGTRSSSQPAKLMSFMKPMCSWSVPDQAGLRQQLPQLVRAST